MLFLFILSGFVTSCDLLEVRAMASFQVGQGSQRNALHFHRSCLSFPYVWYKDDLGKDTHELPFWTVAV